MEINTEVPPIPVLSTATAGAGPRTIKGLQRSLRNSLEEISSIAVWCRGSDPYHSCWTIMN